MNHTIKETILDHNNLFASLMLTYFKFKNIITILKPSFVFVCFVFLHTYIHLYIVNIKQTDRYVFTIYYILLVLTCLKTIIHIHSYSLT